MGKYLDDFRTLIQECPTEMAGEVVTIMYRMLTKMDTDSATGGFDSPEQTTLSASPHQIITVDQLTDAINRATSIGVSEGFLVLSLLRMTSDMLNWLCDGEVRRKQKNTVLEAISQIQYQHDTASNQALDTETIALLRQTIQGMDEGLEELQLLNSEWTRIVSPYIERTKLMLLIPD